MKRLEATEMCFLRRLLKILRITKMINGENAVQGWSHHHTEEKNTSYLSHIKRGEKCELFKTHPAQWVLMGKNSQEEKSAQGLGILRNGNL